MLPQGAVSPRLFVSVIRCMVGQSCCPTCGAVKYQVAPNRRCLPYSYQSYYPVSALRCVDIISLLQGPKLTECFHYHCFHASLCRIIRLCSPCHDLFRHRPRPTTPPHQLSFELFMSNEYVTLPYSMDALIVLVYPMLLLGFPVSATDTITPRAATHHRPYCMSTILQVVTCDVCINQNQCRISHNFFME